MKSDISRKEFLSVLAILPLMLSSCGGRDGKGQEELSESNSSNTTASAAESTVSSGAKKPFSVPTYIETFDVESGDPIQKTSYSYDTDARILSTYWSLDADDPEALASIYEYPDDLTQIATTDGWLDTTWFEIENGLVVSATSQSGDEAGDHQYMDSWTTHPHIRFEYEYDGGTIVKSSCYDADSNYKATSSTAYLVREAGSSGRPFRTYADGSLTTEWQYSSDGPDAEWMEVIDYSLGAYGKKEKNGIEYRADEDGAARTRYDIETDSYGNVTKIYYEGNLLRSIEWQTFEEPSLVGVAASFFAAFNVLAL